MNNNTIWATSPAGEWEEAYPIGNGRLGAMVFGNVCDEQIGLNEETIWYGGAKNAHNPDTLRYIPQIKKLLFDGEVEKASYMARMAMTSTPKYINAYQPLGYLAINFENHNGNVGNYTRELDLNEAITYTKYELDGVGYTREFLASCPDNVIAMKFTASEKGKLSFCTNINRRPYDGISKAISNDSIMTSGDCGADGVRFACVMKAVSKDGNIQTIGDYIYVQNSTEVTLFLTSTSTFRHADYLEYCMNIIDIATKKTYDAIKQAHILDYKKLFDRTILEIHHNEDNLPTDKLIDQCRNGHESVRLTTLFFNFGKYLLISSSREGTLPSNLQGIWNSSYTPSWECNYTININTQMNYWMAQSCNLSECHMPLFNFIERLCENGKKTAKELYGCNGFVAHHITNMWAQTTPLGILAASPFWPMGGGWLSLHMWEYYNYTMDKNFLKERAYPILKQAAIFFTEYLTPTLNGYLVSGPSISPENTYITSKGEKGALCMGPSMDTQIIAHVFEACIKSCEILNIDSEFADKLNEIKSKLPPIKLGKYGQIMEWYEDYDEVEPGHRHISQLFALYPGNSITKSKTPKLFEGAKATLKRRLENGGGHTGWSKAWIINFYARLFDGEAAYKNLIEMFCNNVRINLFNVHPPFQIDGNFGGAAAIVEMLVQSHEGFINLLPALPKAFSSGELSGICCRDGFELSLSWKNSTVTSLIVKSIAGIRCRILSPLPQKIVDLDKREIEFSISDENIICFDTISGQQYVFEY